MSQFSQFLPIILIVGVMYFLLVMPQQRQRKEHGQLMNSLVEGDEIVLNSGIHGFITELEPGILWLEISEGVDLKVSRTAVAAKVTPEDGKSEE